MTEKERLIETLNHREPDKVPHFELMFQLTEEEFGESFVGYEDVKKAVTKKEREQLIRHDLTLFRRIVERFNWCAVPITSFWGNYWFNKDELYFDAIKMAREEYFSDGKTMVVAFNGHGTFGIPDGHNMLEFSYAFFDKPDEMKEQAKGMVKRSIEDGKKQIDSGAEMIIINTDYAFNANPFLSPPMFAEFVLPYLKEIVKSFKDMGAWVILHSDGNLNPIMDLIAEAGLDGIQSIDPQGFMDIAVIKRKYGDKLTLMGNVQCSMLQEGPEESIRESVRYAINSAKPGGGYIFSTSNVIFRGMPLEHYYIMLDEYEKLAYYK